MNSTGHINHTRTPVWLASYTKPSTEEYKLLQECNHAIAAAVHTASIQEFWAQPRNVNEVAHSILRLGAGPCKDMNLTLEQIVQVLAVARPEWALALQSATPLDLCTMVAKYAARITEE